MQASSAPHVVITHFSLSQNAQSLVGRYLRHYLLKKCLFFSVSEVGWPLGIWAYGQVAH